MTRTGAEERSQPRDASLSVLDHRPGCRSYEASFGSVRERDAFAEACVRTLRAEVTYDRDAGTLEVRPLPQLVTR